ncbi:MAG: helix-turn-helix domain-containing protein [Lachnospiraceae bacterium]|nr:helix-turn-helix domain-containing protein [Lachnospiraceae bacterium]
MNELKRIRTSKKITQKEAAMVLGISLRSYVTYENDQSKEKSLKYKYLVRELEKYNQVDEEHGVLKIEDIKNTCKELFGEYEVDYCYLFGSYAKGKAKETSDVDLLISTKATGLRYFELVERLRSYLCKRVDLLDFKQLNNNEELLNDILKDGIKIYG